MTNKDASLQEEVDRLQADNDRLWDENCRLREELVIANKRSEIGVAAENAMLCAIRRGRETQLTRREEG